MAPPKLNIRNYIYMRKSISKTKVSWRISSTRTDKTPQLCQKITPTKKRKIFRLIFKLFDGDEEDWKIYSWHINASKLPKHILRILDIINYICLSHGMKEEN